jgi:acyl-coenzyme A synthetase/AMP-(fatty) acid ligase
VRGRGLALGCLNRPELTEERFPIAPLAGERLYRSGDLGRLRLDGTPDHTGRLDEQVKIRGFRIEVAEVRSVLLEDAGVAEAVVLAMGLNDGPEHARLVGYLVLEAGASIARSTGNAVGGRPRGGAAPATAASSIDAHCVPMS